MGQCEAPLEARISAVLSRVLVVDDRFSRGLFSADLLRSFKCTVRTAPSLAAGRTVAAAWNPQVIVASHEENGLDGIGFTRNLRRSGLACRKAAVIIQLVQPKGPLMPQDGARIPGSPDQGS